MNVILRIEMMDAFGVDSVFEGRHRAMMAHPPVSKAATMDSSVLTKAAKPLGVPVILPPGKRTPSSGDCGYVLLELVG